MAGLSRLTLRVPLDAVLRLLRVARRGVLLMRRVRMIFAPEVLGLARWTFAIPGREFSPNQKAFLSSQLARMVRARLTNPQAPIKGPGA